MKKRLLALILAVIMVTSMLPLSASAYSTGYPNTWTNTGNQAYDIAQIALTQVGYVETVKNHTKYNAWFYGYDKEDPWCAIFISWCANQAGIPTSTIKKQASALKGKFGTPTYGYSSSIQVGDIAYIGKAGGSNSSHVGIVVDVSGSTIKTVEGNNSDKVKMGTFSLSNGKRNGSQEAILFYGRPNYGGSGSTPPSVPVGTTSKPNVSVSGRTVNVSWSYSGSGTSFDVYVIQSPWDWSGIKYKQNVTGNSCTFWDVDPGYYNVFTVAQPNNRQVQSEWAELIVQEPHTNHSNGGFRYTASEHPHYNYYSCSVCGQDFTDGSTERNNNCTQCHWEHVWDEGKITQEPSASQPGVRTFTCTICGERKTETIEAGISGTCGDNLTWELDNAGTLTISGSGKMTDYASYEKIYAPWYNSRDSVKRAVIGNGVINIGRYAFYGCEALTSVIIPNSVTSIGAQAFYGCGDLTSMTIPNSVTCIETQAFYICKSLTSVTIPNSVTSIGDNAFAFCYGLTSVTIGNSVTSIGEDAFESCKSLTSITIPNSVANTGGAFNGCIGLTSAGPIGSGCNIEFGWKNAIPKGAFGGCYSLASITIPNSVTSIGEKAFTSGMSLTAIWVDSGNTAYTSMNGVLFTKDLKTLVAYPGGKQGAYTIPNSVTSIGDDAFSACSSNLTSITIPDSVTSIGNQAFQFCDSLTSVTIPNSVTSIGNSAFFRCLDLTIVTIPNSVTSIGEYAFYGTSLTDVYYAGTKTQWEAIKVMGYNEPLYNARLHYTKEDTPTPTPDPTPVPTPAPTPGNPGGFDPTPEPEEPPMVTFQDVPANAYYAQAVSWAVANGITSGVRPGQFGPDMRCTRAQMVTFLWKAQGQPEPESAENPFVDVKPSDYCYKAVLWAVENGISGGTDSTHFSPSLSCDRSQAVTFIWRTEGKPEAETLSSFSDVSSKSYYAKAIDWAVEYGIVNGVGGGKYDPKGVCSRAQIVTMLYRDAGN